MKIRGIEINLTEDGNYFPNTLILNGEQASMEAYKAKYGYSWKTSASGNVLCYMTTPGKEYKILQTELAKA